MSYIKNYNVGQTKVDLPYANYIHTLPLLSFGDVQHTVNLSLVFNLQMKEQGGNPFGIADGYKLSLQKRLIVGENGLTDYQDESGKKISLNKFGDKYTFSDESQRIIRKDGSEYVLENPDYSTEKYNASGYIIGVYDKYDDDNAFLVYAYSGTKLASITYRTGKVISVTYPTTQSVKIEYKYNGAVKCSTTLDCSVADQVKVVHYSGVDFYFNLTNKNLTVTSKDNGSANTKKSTIYTVSGNTITAVNYTGLAPVDQNVYTFPGSTIPALQKYSQAIITDFHGVHKKIQFKGEKPMYSFEVHSISGEDKLAPRFDSDNKHTGNVKIYNSEETSESANASGTQSVFSGLSLTKSGATHLNNTVYSGALEGYYTISGWLKPVDVTYTIVVIISFGNGSIVRVPLDYTPNKEWTYFRHRAQYAIAPTSVYFEDLNQNITSKDFRIDFCPTVDEADLNDERVPYVVNSEEMLVRDWNNYCKLRDVVFKYNGAIIEDHITAKDILKYQLNKRKNQHSDEFYVNECKELITISSTDTITATIGDTDYALTSCSIGKKTYTSNGTLNTRTRTDATLYPLIQETSYSASSVITSKKYDLNLDLVYEENDGVCTTFTRNAKGLVTLEKTESTANDMDIITRSSAYDSSITKLLSTTDEFSETTTYTTDDVWGVVKYGEASTHERAEKEFDDDMTDLNSITFFRQGTLRNTSFTYDLDKVASVKQNDLKYGFSYYADDLTGVFKQSASGSTISQIEAHSKSKDSDNNTTIVSSYPSASAPTYTVTKKYDKYGRLTEISGEIQNTYDSKPSYSNNVFVPKADNKDSLLAVSKDLITGNSTRYRYDNEKLIMAETIKTSDSSNVSIEQYTYDGLERLTEDLYVSGNFRYKNAYTYKYPVGNIKADGRIGTVSHSIDGIEKVSTRYEYDKLKRVTEKEHTFSNYKFNKGFLFNKTRISNVKDKRNATLFHNVSYTYDNLGRITAETDSVDTSRNVQYQYDAFGQLSRENNKTLDKTIIYSYNNIGNLTSVKTYAYTTAATPSGTYTEQAYTYDGTHKDRLTVCGAQEITYNSLGCPTGYYGKELSWSKGKLSALALGPTTYRFSYNASGQRISKVQNNFGTDYSRVEYTYDNSGRLITEIKTTGLNSTPATVRTEYLYDASSMIGFVRSGTTYYFNRNLQGDVTEIYDASGNLKVKYGYDAYGNCTVLSQTTDTTLANANPIRYRGYYFDTETGLYYLNSRYYNPEWRRFISPGTESNLDPSSANGLNLYVYANNDPTYLSYNTTTTAYTYPHSNNVQLTTNASNLSNIFGSLSVLYSAFATFDQISGFVGGGADAGLRFWGPKGFGIPALSKYDSMLGKFGTGMIVIGSVFSWMSSVYNNHTNPNYTGSEAFSASAMDMGYYALKGIGTYGAGIGVGKLAVSSGIAASGLAIAIGGTSVGFLGALAIGGSVAVAVGIAGAVAIYYFGEAIDYGWEWFKEQLFE